MREGGIIRAIRENRPIIIKGPNWDNKDFQYFIRQILLHRKVEFNGEVVDFPEDFMIFRDESNSSIAEPEL